MLHFCASSFWVSFFSHRETRTASEVALAMYFVFLVSSSVAETGFEIAATTADADPDDEDTCTDAAVGGALDLRLVILTGVQS
jgi:hypothetical protein